MEPTIRYTAQQLSSGIDDDPGRLAINANIAGAQFNTYLTYSSKWNNLTYLEKEKFEKSLPFQRTGANEPGINGYLSSDKTYASGGIALNRSMVRKF